MAAGLPTEAGKLYDGGTGSATLAAINAGVGDYFLTDELLA